VFAAVAFPADLVSTDDSLHGDFFGGRATAATRGSGFVRLLPRPDSQSKDKSKRRMAHAAALTPQVG
jgi:hypothetical protein